MRATASTDSAFHNLCCSTFLLLNFPLGRESRCFISRHSRQVRSDRFQDSFSRVDYSSRLNTLKTISAKKGFAFLNREKKTVKSQNPGFPKYDHQLTSQGFNPLRDLGFIRPYFSTRQKNAGAHKERMTASLFTLVTVADDPLQLGVSAWQILNPF